MWIKIPAVIIILLMAKASAQAQDAQNAEQNMQFLESAMGQLYLGVVAEDAAVIRAFLFAENDPDHVLVEAQTQRILANVRFTKAIGKNSDGQQKSGFFVNFRLIDPGEWPWLFLASNDWEIKGNKAILPPVAMMGGGEEGIVPPLINVRGVWKVNITPEPLKELAQAVAEKLHRHAQIVNEAAEAIEEGKLKTVEQVEQALKHLPPLAPSPYSPDIVITSALPATQPRQERE